MAELLLEIGCEEIPASWLPGLAQQLGAQLTEAAQKEYLEPKEVVALQGPRRLVVSAQIVGRQPDREDKVWGPTLKVAKDPKGAWTNAATGFAKKNGVAVEALQQAPKDPANAGELNLLFIKKTAGRASGEVLPGVIGSVLRGLSFPKRMSWDAWLDDGKGAFAFGRPIRWLVALFDGQVVPFTIYEMKAGAKAGALVTSGDRTVGHRFLPKKGAGAPVAVTSLADLKKKLAERFVFLDPADRTKRIEEALAPVRGEIHDDHGQPAEWRDLVEYPTVLFGTIPAQFRNLPVSVLETVLVHHQKYVPLLSGGAVTRFAAVVNGDGGNGAEIVRGMERVVTARLRDGSFFYEEDRKRSLESRVADLAGVTFHRDLGTYAQKAERMVRLIDAMHSSMGVLTQAEHELARQAARLAKADLTTLMVREFTELQGVMGGVYLRAEGSVSPHVAAAVQWHYHPTSIEEGSAPALAALGDPTVFGAVSVADKLDTLAGYFGLGLIPTGSSDPFGLRRAAQGVIRVLLEFWTAATIESRPNLRALVRAALEPYGAFRKRSEGEITKDLETFLLDRLRYVLVSRGFPGEEVEAVLGAREPDPLDDPHEALVRLKALHAVRSEAREDFEALAAAFKRAKNILGNGAPASADPALFQEDAEKELYKAVDARRSVTGGYDVRLRSLAGLRAPVDRFFDDVLVMAEDPKVRSNRLGLLSQTLSLFYRVADISRLGG